MMMADDRLVEQTTLLGDIQFQRGVG